MLFFDLFVGLSFLASNWFIWNRLNDELTTNSWGPFQIAIVPHFIANNTVQSVGTYTLIPNYPFILFWMALIGNLIIGLWILKGNKK